MSDLTFTEIQSELLAGLLNADFTPAFPSGYTGSKSVLLVPGWPMDLVDNMLGETQGQMTRPIVSVLAGDITTDDRSIGGASNLGAGGAVITAVRVNAAYVVSCWADLRMGGADTAVALGSVVMGWALLNRFTLPAFRQLQTSRSGEAYQTRSQVWTYDLTLSGYALMSYS